MNSLANSTADPDRLKGIYISYIDFLNPRHLERLPEVVDPSAYREICVGFTPGWTKFPESIQYFKKLLRGVPDLRAQLEECISEGNKVYARLKVTGTHKGSLFGAPGDREKL